MGTALGTDCVCLRLLLCTAVATTMLLCCYSSLRVTGCVDTDILSTCALLSAPNADMIQQGIEWLQKEMSDDRPVYIHCAHGHGRSATVLSALLINNGQAKTAEEAVAIMR